ncbi:CGNR zinc finger domain-containing protein [Nonomuraea turcica]|uniref:CGNR zinc finger domain-containing protein n=1 Tax=Nonomuraea sp. G32 TaxID=3067274 RepID=UPI00273C7839|nr:CGNR zinc finger domain-containing protein [Nonomuraea sp. G32]MDP4511091.1 CGNR zinc finger domain-containing protein [Nonomuraea sp. G32]
MRQFAETGIVAIDLANTWDEYLDDPERLPDVPELRRFCRELGVELRPGAADLDSAPGGLEAVPADLDAAAAVMKAVPPALVAVRAVRERLRAVLLAGDPPERTRALAQWTAELPVRAAVEDADGLPRLRLTAPADAPLAERLAVRSVADLLDLAASGDWERLRLCAARPCQDAFVDRSRPGRRQFCSTRCANRAHAAASRARHR